MEFHNFLRLNIYFCLLEQRSQTFHLKEFCWIYFTLAFIYGFLNPIFEIHNICVHSISSLSSTAYSPADHAHKKPFVIPDADQRSSTVSLTCVNRPTSITCATHACCDFVSSPSYATVGVLASVTWNKGNFRLLQNLLHTIQEVINLNLNWLMTFRSFITCFLNAMKKSLTKMVSTESSFYWWQHA